MGLFGGKRESPMTGEIILRFQLTDVARVTFTLDKGPSGRTWYAGMAPLLTSSASPISTIEEALGLMVPNAWAVVLKVVPSALKKDLRIQLDHDSQDTEVVCTGEVTFLASEWQTYKKKAMAGR